MLQISGSGDDGFITVATSAFDNSGNTLTHDVSARAFWRFEVPIYPSAGIESAYLNIVAANDNTSPVDIIMFFDWQDNPTAPSGYSDFISRQGNPMGSSVTWTVPSFVANNVYTSPNLRTMLQEIVTRPGWVYNNKVVLITSGSGVSGSRLSYTYDLSGAVSAANLTIAVSASGSP